MSKICIRAYITILLLAAAIGAVASGAVIFAATTPTHPGGYWLLATGLLLCLSAGWQGHIHRTTCPIYNPRPNPDTITHQINTLMRDANHAAEQHVRTLHETEDDLTYGAVYAGLINLVPACRNAGITLEQLDTYIETEMR